MAAMTQRYVDVARRDDDEPAVFYIDNHLRQYTRPRRQPFRARSDPVAAHPGHRHATHASGDVERRPLRFELQPS
jgi:hypothetical protein